MWIRFIAIAGLMWVAVIPGVASAASPGRTARSVCGRSPGGMQCFAKVLTEPNGTIAPDATPAGYNAAQLRSAYGVSGSGSQTVAVVDAYGDPKVKSDLDVYSRDFKLPVLPSCRSASQTACFAKTDQRGGQQLSRADSGWALETALDVEAVHTMCTGCRIQLVEADSATDADLMAAVDRAVSEGADLVSMSWGGPESSSETALDAHFRHPSTIFVASSGDAGYGASYPAASGSVTAVGGTHLELSGSETAWSDGGSGCSRYEAKPSWQHDTACKHRTIADVSADADPATGAAVYSSLSPSGSGWFVVGGTSLSAPLVAGLAADARNTSQSVLMSRLYSSLGSARLRDIATGANGRCTTYLCRAVAGYDGPTGVGTPTGPGAF